MIDPTRKVLLSRVGLLARAQLTTPMRTNLSNTMAQIPARMEAIGATDRDFRSRETILLIMWVSELVIAGLNLTPKSVNRSDQAFKTNIIMDKQVCRDIKPSRVLEFVAH